MHKYSVHNRTAPFFRFPSADPPLPLSWQPLAPAQAARRPNTAAARGFSVVAAAPTITCFPFNSLHRERHYASAKTCARECARNAGGMREERGGNALGLRAFCPQNRLVAPGMRAFSKIVPVPDATLEFTLPILPKYLRGFGWYKVRPSVQDRLRCDPRVNDPSRDSQKGANRLLTGHRLRRWGSWQPRIALP